jgi:hypothetical protein
MIQTTIGAILQGDPLSDIEDCCLYVVRDGPTVFYVGQTNCNAMSRLREHWGAGERPKWDLLGKLIKANLPDSLARAVEFREPRYKTEIPAIRENDLAFQFFGKCEALEFYSQHDINRTERELIRELRPCLNTTYNTDPNSLPKCYTDPRVTDLETTVSDFIPI